MISFTSLFVAAASFAIAVAQTPIVAFTYVPAVVVAGNQYNITWGGGDGTPVTLTLRKGNPNNLDTIAILASRITDSYYMWTVDTNLETASDYALQIQQGVNNINYSGLFSLVDGTGSSSISYTGASRTISTAASTGGTIITTGVTMARTTASSGMNMTMSRNTTFSTPTLSSTGRTITTAASTFNFGTSTIANQQTSAPTGNAAVNGASMGSSAAIVMGLLGAIMFLQ